MREWFNWLLGVAGFVYFALCLQMIARKTGTRHSWMAWIPVLDFILMCRIAGRSGWWLLLFIILGLFNQNVAVIGVIIFGVILCMGMTGALGKPIWLGLLMFVPVVNLAVIGYLAFSNEKTA